MKQNTNILASLVILIAILLLIGFLAYTGNAIPDVLTSVIPAIVTYFLGLVTNPNGGNND